jgi:hypothetical protein
MKSQLISSAMLVVALSAIPVYGQQQPKIKSPQKLLLNPQIIATFKSQGQVEAIPVAGLFVPDTDGLYRITTYFARSHTTQEPAYMQIYWSDNHAQPGVATIAPTYAGVPNIIAIQVKAGQPVYYSTYVHLSYENRPFATYDVSATVERLQ